MTNTFPNLIVIGVHKAGTTSLYKYLGDHPDVYASFKKELHVFTPLLYGQPPDPVENYNKYFKNADSHLMRLEASPSYLYGGKAIIEDMGKVIDKPKFIVILRNPVDRFISFHKQMISTMKIDKNENIALFFEKSLKEYNSYVKTSIILDNPYNRSIREGLYSDYLVPWLNLDKDRLFIAFFDDLKDSPRELLSNICSWLTIPSVFYQKYDFQVENKSLKHTNVFLHKKIFNCYMNHEDFFRRNIFLKNMLKKVYSIINYKEYDNNIDSIVLEALSNIYIPANSRLAHLLAKYGYQDLPNWVEV